MPICQKRRHSDVNVASSSPVKRFKVATGELKSIEILRSADALPDDKAVAHQIPVAISSIDAVLINLARRPDRLQECSDRLAANCPGLRWKRLAACEGKKEVIELSDVSTAWHSRRNVEYQKIRATRKGWNDHESYVARQYFMSAGERGCAMSHVRAWRMCAERTDDKPLLVLEDDAEPIPEFNRIFAQCMETLPQDADIVYLGYSQAAPWRREVGPVLVEAEYVWTTVAYLIWPRCAKYLLEQLPVDQPVDNWMACLCADQKVKSYCARPKIVRQAGEWNIDSDIRHSDEHYWGKDSNIQHSDFTGSTHNSLNGVSEASSSATSTSDRSAPSYVMDLSAETSDEEEDSEENWV